MTIGVSIGDITRFVGDAIVNAANEWMLGGGGVDGAIHRAAGPELLAACRAVPEVAPGVRCPTGQARITPGFALPARFVIHTVGPRWRGGMSGEDEALASAYRRSLTLASENGLHTIAFPAISTGVFGFPMQRASSIAVRVVAAYLEQHADITHVELVCWGESARRTFANALAAHSRRPTIP